MLVDAGRRWQMLADADTYRPQHWSYGRRQPTASTHLLGKSPLAAVSELGTTRGTTDAHTRTASQSQHSFPSSSPAAIPSMPPEHLNAVTLQPPAQHGACNTTRHRQTLLCARLFRGIRAQGPALLATASRQSGLEEDDAGSGVLGCWDGLGRCRLGMLSVSVAN